jgi:hypothetical protein
MAGYTPSSPGDSAPTASETYETCAFKEAGFAGQWTKAGWEPPTLSDESAAALIADKGRIRAIMGRSLSSEEQGSFLTPVRRALTFIEHKTRALTPALKFQLLCAFVDEIKAVYPKFRAEAPSRNAAGDGVIRGKLAFVMLVRSDGEIYLGDAGPSQFFRLHRVEDWTPDYDSLEHLPGFLSERQRIYLEQLKKKKR